jgi:two-component system, OmpR family, sensor histidine kinase KdpD
MPSPGIEMTRAPLGATAQRAQLAAMDETSPRREGASIAMRVQAYAGALAMVAVATLAGMWIAPRWGTAPVDMIYLPAVLAAAAMWGLGPALLAGAGAALAYNFFFTEPIHTFRMDRVADIVTVVVLLIVALVTSRLASGIRAQARIAAAHAARNATIAGFARRLLSSSSEQQIADTACTELRRLFDCNVMMVKGTPEPRVIASAPAGNRLTPSDVAAAALTLQTGEPAGRGTGQAQPAEWVFHSVRSDGATIAAVGLARDDGMTPVEEQQMPLLTSLLDQLALAFERARLDEQTRQFEAVRDRDRLRSALLSSIGDDLKPPLASISRAVRDLKRAGSGDKTLLSAIGSETAKLERWVANLVELEPAADRKPISVGDVTIDLFRRAVSKDGRDIHLTPKEYAVLAELAKYPGRVLTHEHLLRTAWGPAQETQTEYLRVAVRALRQKLERNPARPEIIMNEPAVGYRLVS